MWSYFTLRKSLVFRGPKAVSNCRFLVPEEDMVPVRPPKVMVAQEHWEELARGLIDKGICEVIGEDDVYKVKGQPLLNGLFGVTKHEWEGNIEIHRLIMNLIPVNSICRGVEGDVSTLPSLSGLAPIFLGKDERLLVSSEDVRCLFFYIFKIPVEWRRFMAFNKPLPPALCPANGRSFAQVPKNGFNSTTVESFHASKRPFGRISVGKWMAKSPGPPEAPCYMIKSGP